MSLVETLAVISLEFPVGDTVKFKFNMSVIKILLKIHHMLAAHHQTTEELAISWISYILLHLAAKEPAIHHSIGEINANDAGCSLTAGCAM